MAPKKLISVATVQQHSKADDCWLVVDDNVWDLTDFGPKHPGGADIILRYAGRNASSTYNSIHPPNLLHDETPSALIGTLDPSTIPPDWTQPPPSAATTPSSEKPPLSTVLNAHDFELIAARTVSPKTWAFYSSAATDCVTRDANASMFSRLWLRPRVLRDVSRVSTRARILGCETEVPVFVSPAAMVGMVHPEGERVIARGCAGSGVVQCISTSASLPASTIISASTALTPTHPSFFQLYINRTRTATRTLLTHLRTLSTLRALFITVDAPVVGKREADERLRSDESIRAPMTNQRATNDAKGGGMGRVMGGYIDPSFAWEDIAWVRSQVDVPIVLKGIQTAADARLAVRYGVQGIVVSNHGGRCLDTSPPSILALLDIQRNAPEVFDQIEVYVDGGIRRGTDVVKALALGATAVGMGRPFLWAANYGEEGVRHLVEIMKDEIETTMRLLGVNHLSDLEPGMVNTADVDHLVPTALEGHPYARKIQRAKL